MEIILSVPVVINTFGVCLQIILQNDAQCYENNCNAMGMLNRILSTSNDVLIFFKDDLMLLLLETTL